MELGSPAFTFLFIMLCMMLGRYLRQRDGR